MKITFYFGGFSPIGGIETSARNLLDEIRKQGWNIELVCWGPQSELLRRMRSSGIRIRRSRWRWGCRLGLPDWAMLPLGLVSSAGSDVVLLGKLTSPTIIRILRYFSPTARYILMTPYRPIPPATETKRKEARDAYDAFSEVWVQSTQFEDDLREIGCHVPVRVVPYMPEQLPKLSAFPLGPIRIGFLGRLVEDKNLPLLLNAFRQIIAMPPPCGDSVPQLPPLLDIIGDGPLRQSLEDQTRLLGLEQYVRFRGAIPQHTVKEAVTACHLFVFTSHVEGQCIAALEVLACGRPVVATKAGAFPEILSDRRLGRLVTSNDANNVAKEILDVIDAIVGNSIGPSEIQEAFSERFGPGRVGRRYLDLISTL